MQQYHIFTIRAQAKPILFQEKNIIDKNNNIYSNELFPILYCKTHIFYDIQHALCSIVNIILFY